MGHEAASYHQCGANCCPCEERARSSTKSKLFALTAHFNSLASPWFHKPVSLHAATCMLQSPSSQPLISSAEAKLTEVLRKQIEHSLMRHPSKVFACPLFPNRPLAAWPSLPQTNAVNLSKRLKQVRRLVSRSGEKPLVRGYFGLLSSKFCWRSIGPLEPFQ